jgi:hypothetical protein
VEDPQVLLNPEALDRLRSGFDFFGAGAGRLFSETVLSMRTVVGDALAEVFFLALFVALLALATSFLIKELPLRTTVHDERAPVLDNRLREPLLEADPQEPSA